MRRGALGLWWEGTERQFSGWPRGCLFLSPLAVGVPQGLWVDPGLQYVPICAFASPEGPSLPGSALVFLFGTSCFFLGTVAWVCT